MVRSLPSGQTTDPTKGAWSVMGTSGAGKISLADVIGDTMSIIATIDIVVGNFIKKAFVMSFLDFTSTIFIVYEKKYESI
jgi:Holliday junction resolvasome RuvABC ATP-dependent DNA helicase subunit